ncbi:thiamine-phosphate kinase [Nocardia speluncae]|uniref:Thiamine-monophosphate kinase n=1 Tax=Nocardia speluncae TaxID=419477 RepID=A0A846XGM2_9NOCA|nr:thiamine-phosphate kinase [Nocardia speluncae]NKY35278.1 thiamine-phosphate kinase [Nocardia speluncae]
MRKVLAISIPPTVRDLGEFALIDRINAGRAQGPAVRLGPGDDAAVLTAARGNYVVSTDMLIEDRHFRLDWSNPDEIGRKAIAQNAADIYAMGAEPVGYVIGLGLPGDTPVDFVSRLADGFWAEAERAGGSVAGGDIVHSAQLVISVTAFGDPLGDRPVTRSGARVGGTVAIAGRPGWSAAGFALLSQAHQGVMRRHADSTAAVVVAAAAAHRAPRPAYDLVRAAMGTATPPEALTDISDGLLADLGHLAAASGVAVAVDSAALRDPDLQLCAAELEADARQWILTGGEDHVFAGVWAPGEAPPPGWTLIGRIEAGRGVAVDGALYRGAGGWEAFSGSDSAK